MKGTKFGLSHAAADRKGRLLARPQDHRIHVSAVSPQQPVPQQETASILLSCRNSD